MTNMKAIARTRKQSAMTIVEMLVSLAIIGVAIAGLGELLWINGAFSGRLFNKVDSLASTGYFLELVGRDVRTASGASGDQQNLTLQIPYTCDPLYDPVSGQHQSNPDGFPSKALDTVTYTVSAVNGTITRTFTPDPTYNDPLNVRSEQTSTVLSGLQGPTDNGGTFHTFDYYTSQNGAVSSVVVNLDVNTSTGSSTQTAQIGLRREFYLRDQILPGY